MEDEEILEFGYDECVAGGLGRERGGRFERSNDREGLDLGEEEGSELTCREAILLLLLLVLLCSSDKSRSFFDKV